MKRLNAHVLFIVVTLALLALDRITKVIAIDVLTDSGPIAFLPAFLDFVLVYNRGGAFGLFEGAALLFVGVAVVAVMVIIIYLARARQLRMPIVVALSLISAGALGNAYDRAVSGAVPDFIHTLFIQFPVFNIADCCLTVGEIILIIVVAYYWFGPKSKETVDSGLSTESNQSGVVPEATRSTHMTVASGTFKPDGAPELDTGKTSHVSSAREADSASKRADENTSGKY